MATEVRASHILVSDEKKASDLKQKIEGGEAFAEMARQHSSCPSGKRGGDLGWFKRGAMVKPFEDACFNSTGDEVIGPVKTQFGYHLIQVTGRK